MDDKRLHIESAKQTAKTFLLESKLSRLSKLPTLLTVPKKS